MRMRWIWLVLTMSAHLVGCIGETTKSNDSNPILPAENQPAENQPAENQIDDEQQDEQQQDEQIYETQTFAGKYRIEDKGTCSSFFELSFIGYEPTKENSQFPLFIYTVGTLDNFENLIVQEILKNAASRGFVAISVQYYNALVATCSDVLPRAKCIYDPNETDSALTKVCSKDNVDCSNIVTMGHSQGAGMALMAKNYNTNVKAALLLSASSDIPSDFEIGLSNPDPEATEFNCLHYTNLTQEGHQVRILNGENEQFGDQDNLSRMTGLSCPKDQMNCLNDDGSGWYIVPNNAVQDLEAEHNFFVFNSNGNDLLDSGFTNPSNEWSLPTGLDWLKSNLD